MAKKKKEAAALVEIPKPDIRMAKVKIVGDTSLICHQFSDKQRIQILDKQMKKAKVARPEKDPDADYKASLYPMGGSKNGRYGFPASAFKLAMVSACTHVPGVTKVLSRGAFFIIGGEKDLVEIKGKPRMREDNVRVGRGAADIRFRGEFPEWSVELTVRYNGSVISLEQITNLMNMAGFAVGVGDWRPERSGTHGTFHVAEG